jgi:hypothetical protein
MAFENLPEVKSLKIDGQLLPSAVNENPVVVVIGTAPRGPSESLYTVDSISNGAQAFGRSDGTLVRGMYEARAGGAENLRLMRIGAVAAKLETVGGGITIETVSKDAGAGADYKIFWDDAAARLRVWRVSDDLLVYDNNPTYPSAKIDENEVSVSGTASGNPGDIGTLLSPITLVDADGVSSAVYTAGSDGILLSRMELFEALFVAYKLLENEDLDVVLPQNIYLDDVNVKDMTTAEVSALNTGAPWASSAVYPEPQSFYDALGLVFAQEYQGEWYFWWDLDNDGLAEIYPSVGSADDSTDAFGNALEAADYHQANFAYQLADFCYRQSQDNQEMFGVVGVLPPISWSLKDVSNWIGRLPTYTEDSAGNAVVDANGTGLLGNKWMAGRKSVGGTGLPGHTVSSIDGLAYGGFIATDNGWPDGAELTDRNDRLVDIGKYLSVVGAQAVLSNPAVSTAYVASSASTYAGFVSTLPASSAPTNKLQPGVRLPFRVGVAKLDTLAGLGYVMLQEKPKGIVVADAPTATRPDSDYRRLTTFKIVKATIDGIRAAAEPFLGEGITGTRLAGLETAIQQVLVRLQKGGFLQRFDVLVTSTPQQQVLGQADVELVLVPAFELRQITIHVGLAAQ